jgi:hypothetical protein
MRTLFPLGPASFAQLWKVNEHVPKVQFICSMYELNEIRGTLLVQTLITGT